MFRIGLLKIIVSILAILPEDIQKKIYTSNRIHSREMDFTVSPNSLWTAYEITNETAIQEYIPSDLELSDIRIFKYDSCPKKYLFFNFFHVETPYFHGHRLEIVAVVKEKSTNKHRFIILDYYSDTISSDPIQLFKKPNAKHMSLYNDDELFIVYMDNLYFIKAHPSKKFYEKTLCKEFSIDCNKKIYYGSKHIHKPNKLSFDENNVQKIHLLNAECIYNNLWTHCRKKNPDAVFYFPNPILFKIIPEDDDDNVVFSQKNNGYNKYDCWEKHSLFEVGML